MSKLLDERREWIYELLDMMDGSDHLSRTESSAAPSGFGEAITRHGICGQCGGKGCARCEGGKVTWKERDAYDNSPNGYTSPKPDESLTDKDREYIPVLRAKLSGCLVSLDRIRTPALRERVSGTSVERTAFRQLPHLLGIAWLTKRLRTAPDWIREEPRAPDAVEWLARRSMEDGVAPVRSLY